MAATFPAFTELLQSPETRAQLGLPDRLELCTKNKKTGKRTCKELPIFGSFEVSRAKGGTPARPEAFDYWTASVVRAAPGAFGSKSARVKAGCLFERVHYTSKKGKRKGQTVSKDVALPYRCPPGSKGHVESGTCRTPEGQQVEPIRDWRCGPQDTKPCQASSKEGRRSCPVQLVWRDGSPYLRFCTETNKPGHLVAVDNPRDAQGLAARACAQWKRDGKRFTADNPAVQVAEGLGGLLDAEE